MLSMIFFIDDIIMLGFTTPIILFFTFIYDQTTFAPVSHREYLLLYLFLLYNFILLL